MTALPFEIAEGAGAASRFDYSIFDAETAALAIRKADAIRERNRRTVIAIIQTGADLLEVKEEAEAMTRAAEMIRDRLGEELPALVQLLEQANTAWDFVLA